MWFKIQGQEIQITILAKPNAKKSALVAVSEQGLHIALHAKPHEGEANKELIAYLAKLFQLPKSQISLKRGETSRFKQVIMPMNNTIQKLLNDPSTFIKGKLHEHH